MSSTDSRPRCGGSGMLYEELTPQFDHRDPRHEVKEWDCPGCLDCGLRCCNCGAQRNDLIEHEGQFWCPTVGDCDRTLR